MQSELYIINGNIGIKFKPTHLSTLTPTHSIFCTEQLFENTFIQYKGINKTIKIKHPFPKNYI